MTGWTGSPDHWPNVELILKLELELLLHMRNGLGESRTGVLHDCRWLSSIMSQVVAINVACFPSRSVSSIFFGNHGISETL